MRWIGKFPPLYVWDGDTWFNEINGNEYIADITKALWVGSENVPFPKKTRVIK